VLDRRLDRTRPPEPDAGGLALHERGARALGHGNNL
jgi:hypothetical protein